MMKEICSITKKELRKGEAIKIADIREGIAELICRDHPELSRDSVIGLDQLNVFRRAYLSSLINQEKGEIAKIDEDVMNAIANNSILSENISEVSIEKLSFGQKLADKVAEFGGSWAFIVTFFFFYVFVDHRQCVVFGPSSF